MKNKKIDKQLYYAQYHLINIIEKNLSISLTNLEKSYLRQVLLLIKGCRKNYKFCYGDLDDAAETFYFQYVDYCDLRPRGPEVGSGWPQHFGRGFEGWAEYVRMSREKYLLP